VNPVTIAAVVLVVVVILVLAYLSIRIVNEYDRLVVFRLGRTGPDKVKGPGLVLLIPVIDRPVRADLREQFIEVPSQTTITKDNAPISIDFLIYWRIVDPLKSIVNVAYFAGALQGIATTTLRAVIGDILLDDVLSKREQINEVLRAKLDEQTERWGGKVTTVEIREITPPREVQDAMNRMLSAERNRRAVITESEGARQANINVAEGEKQAAILRAEGQRQSRILEAEGFSEALERIFQAASRVDERTMVLQYMDALKALGASPSTKYILPLELTELAQRIGKFVDRGMAGGEDAEPPPTPPSRPSPPAPSGGPRRVGPEPGVGAAPGTRPGTAEPQAPWQSSESPALPTPLTPPSPPGATPPTTPGQPPTPPTQAPPEPTG
jgi:regulator of protease activity HflC (stomatin/prohibitin superfamily)